MIKYLSKIYWSILFLFRYSSITCANNLIIFRCEKCKYHAIKDIIWLWQYNFNVRNPKVIALKSIQGYTFVIGIVKELHFLIVSQIRSRSNFLVTVFWDNVRMRSSKQPSASLWSSGFCGFLTLHRYLVIRKN